MATGHYARIQKKSDRIQLRQAVDLTKDQSYVLHVLDQEQLSHARFPLGEYAKQEVRQLARDFNLPVADRHESQDLCFLGDGDYRDFLTRNSSQAITEGKILNLDGETMGEHDGLAMYTIGQRRGLGISSAAPLYVIDKDSERNSLIIGPKAHLFKQKMWADIVNWVSISPPADPFQARVKIRYKSPEEPATIIPLGTDKVEVHFENPVRDITPGQAAVFYEDDICLGGGIIRKSS